MADKEMALLFERLKLLEENIYGKYDKCMETDSKIRGKRRCIGLDSGIRQFVSDSLLRINSHINSSLAGRDKVKSVLKKVNEIEHYLNPAIGEKLTLEDSTKMDIILTSEDDIRNTAAQLQRISELKSVLDSEHIKAVPSYTTKLLQLSQIELNQEKSAAAFSEDLKCLIATYNNTIFMLTKQFVQWDELVTKLEIAAQTKRKI